MPRLCRLILSCVVSPLCWAELPLFPHTYNMQQSTIAMPCNYTGFMDMSGDIGKFGIIDFDWSNAKQIWANAQPMSSEELLVEQSKRRKSSICPKTCPLPNGLSKLHNLIMYLTNLPNSL